MSHHHHTRRGFLGQLGLGCASIGATSLLSGITNMNLISAAAAANRSPFAPVLGNYKAIVCIMLAGGNDSYNMLVPKGDSEYNQYKDIRGGIALDKGSLLGLDPMNNIGKTLGLHPNLVNIKGLFDDQNAAFIANIGTLVQPTTKSEYNNGTATLPEGMFSHFDQSLHWQTCVPQDRTAKGWGGRLADVLRTNNANQNISMNISLDGVNTFQRGNTIAEYAIKAGDGAVTINSSQNNGFYQSMKRETLDNLMESTYQNIFEKAYAGTISSSKNSAIEFGAALSQGDTFDDSQFGTDKLATRLKDVATVIGARGPLEVSNQTFFVQHGGYDTHDNILEDHGGLMSELDGAVGAFYGALEELGIEDDVLIFTMSDFARKLVSNGDGSDHGWGGHSMIIGKQVNGKKIYGDYPDLAPGNPLDADSGRFIPTTSCDELFAELALWMGASTSDLNQILPNINNFWTPQSGAGPLGILPNI